MSGTVNEQPVLAERLLKCVGIQHVIVVDDIFGPLTVDQAVEILVPLDPAQRAELLGTSSTEALADIDLARAEVERIWEHNEEADAVSHKLRDLDGDAAPASQISGLFQGVRVDGMGLAEWTAARDEVVASSAKERALVLFDRDFTKEGGASDAGDELVRDLSERLSKSDTSRVWCGLLTQAANASSEQELRKAIAERIGLTPARLVVISKEHLGDPFSFGSRLRTVLLAPLLEELMDQVSTKMIEAHAAAKEEASDLSAEELEDIVFRSSQNEGVWEPDTLVRIFSLLLRDRARAGIRDESRVHDVTEAIRCLGKAAATSQGEVEDPGPEAAAEVVDVGERDVSRAWRLQRREIYEDEEDVNRLHLPLELGDIFERSSSGKRYVLVVQPCDLMVRANGERQPELSHFMLAEIHPEGSGESRFDAFELPYYDSDSGASGHVRLNRVAFARSHVLDLCVTNREGESCLRSDEGPAVELLPSWRARHKLLARIAAYGWQLGGSIDQLTGTAQAGSIEAIRKRCAGAWKGDPFPVVLDEPATELRFDCRRVERLSEPYASALLTRFLGYIARDAYLHDFAGR